MSDTKQRVVSTILLATLLINLIVPTTFQAQGLTIQDYLLPGEHIVTLEPELMHNGKSYEIHYFTTSDLYDTKSSIIGLATSESFTQKHITGLLITSNGEIIENEEEIVEILTLYRAAYFLYEVASINPLGFTDFYPFDEFRKDLRKVTGSVWFLDHQIKGLFTSRSEEATEALRGMLTAHYEIPQPLEEFAADLQRQLESREEGVSGFVEIVDTLLKIDKYSNDKNVRLAAADARKFFKSWRPYIEQGISYVEIDDNRLEFFNALDVLSLSINLIWMADLQQERADWVNEYNTFVSSDASFDKDQIAAASIVAAEAEKNWIQRGNIILDFIDEHATDLFFKITSRELAKLWVSWSWDLFGKRTTGHLVAGAAAKAAFVSLASDLIYNRDDLFNNFVFAERADELRDKFYTHRLSLQDKIEPSPNLYDGEFARQFRISYMLEVLATAEMFHLYSNGVEATVADGLFSRLNLVWYLKGAEWKNATAELRNIAIELEGEAEDSLGHPDFLDSAISLIWQRLTIFAPPLGTCDINRNDGIDLHEEHLEGNDVHVVCVDLNDPYLRFQTVLANDVLNINAVPDQRETVQSMVNRLPYELHNPIVAFNADYFGDGHGAEGFAVLNGKRIDGPFSNDFDGNEITRVSQAISRVNQAIIGKRTEAEVSNGRLLLSRYHNATGGGPTLVTNGHLIPDPCPPEGFSNSDECSQTNQTAIGISQDGSRYIIVVAENKTGREMGELLIKYGAYWGMKLDGGSSSQLWYRDKLKMEGVRVANAILIFREEIPRHDAIILEQSQFPIVKAGENFSVTVRLGNTGFLSWESQLDYVFLHVEKEQFSIPSPLFLPAKVDTGYDLIVTLEGIAPSFPGAYQSFWQLIYQDSYGFIEPVSEEIGFLVTVVPEGTSVDFIDSLRQFIDQFLAEIEGNIRDSLDELEREIEARILTELIKHLPPELQCLLGFGMLITNGLAFNFWRKRRGQNE